MQTTDINPDLVRRELKPFVDIATIAHQMFLESLSVYELPTETLHATASRLASAIVLKSILAELDENITYLIEQIAK